MKRSSRLIALASVLLVVLSACQPAPAPGAASAATASTPASAPTQAAPAATSAPAAQPGKMQKVRLALSAFQDVQSIYVGIEKGFYAEEGIEFEIQKTDWPGSNELLIGGHTDLATSSDADVILANAQGQDVTLAFPLYYFAGGGLMYDPQKHNWKSYDDILKETNGDRKEAIKRTLEQVKGTKVGVSAGGGEYATFLGMLEYAGLDVKDYQVVDLAQEELPPAALSGSIDIMIAGIPQRLAVLKQGYGTLIDQTSLPSTVVIAGFGAHRKWIDENPELAAKIQKVIFKTLQYIESNPDESFQIISNHLRESGTTTGPEDLKRVWNTMEFFPATPAAFDKEVASPDGRFYWKSRFESTIDQFKKSGKITELSTPVEDLFYGLKVVKSVQQ